ncbi:MAG: helix-turn-helix domain-containing protein [Treponema sp.]|nr:helix-turn-helix domain-containing protein [Treponema sp.]
MLKPYDLLDGVLNEIEKGLKEGVDENTLADKFAISSVHLRRLFKFAFGRPIGAYIRSRKLAASAEDLLLTGMNVLDIAMEYGLEYEQTYIRAFKREFGLTPGELRKTGQILKITPPLQLFDTNKLANGVFFGPEIVIVPQFHVVGKRHKMPFRYELTLPSYFVNQFMAEDKAHIPNAVNPDVLITISGDDGSNEDYCFFMPAVQVKTPDNVPRGYDCYTFPTSLCAKFRFIGSDDTEDLNMYIADRMFRAIDDFLNDENQKYIMEQKRITFDRFDTSKYGGHFKFWEWHSPVIIKTKSNAPGNPTGIIKTYQQEMPALRFIGKKHFEPANEFIFDKILAGFDKWRLNNTFDAIEKNTDKDLKKLYEGGNAYISLIRKINNELFEYWLGMFMPKGTAVPKGYEMMNFPKSRLGVCSVYDKRKTIIKYDSDCRKKLAEEGIQADAAAKWFFLRFNWHNFFEIDRYGKSILEYCYFF